MICSVKIADETYKMYVGHNPNSPQKAMEQQLERFRMIGSKEKVLILSEQHLRDMEAIRGRSFESPRELVDWVVDRGKVLAGELKLDLSPSALEAYKKRASFYGKDVSQALSEDFNRFLKEKGVL